MLAFSNLAFQLEEGRLRVEKWPSCTVMWPENSKWEFWRKKEGEKKQSIQKAAERAGEALVAVPLEARLHFCTWSS